MFIQGHVWHVYEPVSAYAFVLTAFSYALVNLASVTYTIVHYLDE